MFVLTNKRFASPEIERLIREVITDNARFERELRSAHRETLVCPVEIASDDDGEIIQAFSRNISSMGIALITDQPVEERSTSTLKIYRTNKPPTKIVAECRWCKPFGEKYWVSGWQFMHIPRK